MRGLAALTTDNRLDALRGQDDGECRASARQRSRGCRRSQGGGGRLRVSSGVSRLLDSMLAMVLLPARAQSSRERPRRPIAVKADQLLDAPTGPANTQAPTD